MAVLSFEFKGRWDRPLWWEGLGDLLRWRVVVQEEEEGLSGGGASERAQTCGFHVSPAHDALGLFKEVGSPDMQLHPALLP